MAIYHCSVKNIGRSGGKSAVASSAYRSGEKLEDLETGLSHDYTKKSGIEYTEIILCENAPREYQDRATLWNEVQKVERASDARLAREWELAIPKELTLEQGQKLVHDFGQSLADEGMCVDIAIHDKGDGNRHAHIMGTTRPIKENGEWGAKEKKAYALDENGERIPVIDEKTGQQKVDSRNRKQWKRETIEANDWNKREKVEEWRERWAEHCNRYLERENQIDHRSYERQGLEQVPTIHEGYVARQIEQRGEVSEVCQVNRDIKEYNQLNQIEAQLTRERLNLLEVLRQLKEKAKEAINERLQRLRASRGADEPTGRNADGNRPIQTDNSRPAEPTGENKIRVTEREKEIFTRSIELGTAEPTIGTGEEVAELIRSARTGIDSATAKEKDSGASRADREAQRERLNLERERQAKAREQQLAKERAESQARSRSQGISL